MCSSSSILPRQLLVSLCLLLCVFLSLFLSRSISVSLCLSLSLLSLQQIRVYCSCSILPRHLLISLSFSLVFSFSFSRFLSHSRARARSLSLSLSLSCHSAAGLAAVLPAETFTIDLHPVILWQGVIGKTINNLIIFDRGISPDPGRKVWLI